MAEDPFLERHPQHHIYLEIDRVEAEIRSVHDENEKINGEIKVEEAKIDALSKDIKEYENQLKVFELRLKEGRNIEESIEIGRQKSLVEQRLRNLITYESTLIVKTSSRAEVLRALDKDLVQLYGQRKELRQAVVILAGCHKDMISQDLSLVDGVEQRQASSAEARSRSRNSGKLVIEGMTNVSISSGISSGDDDNREFMDNTNKRDNENMQEEEDDELEEGVEEEHPLRKLKVRRLDIPEDVFLTPQHNGGYAGFQHKENAMEDVAMSRMSSELNKDIILDHDCARESCETPFLEAQYFDTGKRKKATRRTSRITCRHLARKLTVDFDEKGNPVGPNAGGFKRSINSYVCHFMPINFKQIGDVPVEDYKAVLNVLTERFNFDLNKKYTRKKISSCYRQHKYKLMLQIKKEIERGVEPEKPSYVKQEDWDAFVAKTKDEEFAKISNKNKANRSQQSGVHRTGRLGRSGRKRKMKDDSGIEPLDDAWSKALAFKQGTISPTCHQNLIQGIHKND
ncbi:uncharacterized protein LOC131071575 isoform X2 [Cryptomeria japonica]|uniref:uncharacterized protein LOC131071575 isoform X2 n=1 Tax=Cryptomeria japonica TaxID=3369 RepID=UPI0027DA14CA|nr:uncharacterized protein LOC131071575 isoform X2 [Cryptomeria japonica]